MLILILILIAASGREPTVIACSTVSLIFRCRLEGILAGRDVFKTETAATAGETSSFSPVA